MNSKTTFEPNVAGIYDMPAEDYHKAPGVSNSMLGHMDPPARLPVYLTEPKETTPFMRLGTLIHQRILEPETPLPKLACQPEGLSLATKEGKAWKAAQEAEGREILSFKEWTALVGCVDAIRNDELCRGIFAKGRAEVSVFCDLNDVFTKRRIDWVPEGSNALVDIKKVQPGKASADQFAKLMLDRRYHVQAAFYLDGWNALMGSTDTRETFVFIVVEEGAPYLTAKYQVSPEFIQIGREQYRKDLETYKRCAESGQWPGYDTEVKLIEPPAWAVRRSVI